MDQYSEIAQLLGWTLEKHPYETVLVGPGEARLVLSSYNGRLIITGDFGALWDHIPYNRCREHRITVSLDAPPQRVVSEIRRRLLPDYLEVLALAQKRKREYDQRRQAMEDLAKEIASILGSNVHVGKDVVTIYYDALTIEVAYNTVRLLGHVPADHALIMFRALAQAGSTG